MTIIEKLVDNICDNPELWKLNLLIFGIGKEDYAPLVLVSTSLLDR